MFLVLSDVFSMKSFRNEKLKYFSKFDWLRCGDAIGQSEARTGRSVRARKV